MIEGQHYDTSQATAIAAPVYVIDDEAGVRLALIDLLEGKGHRVWPFSSGADLLDALDMIEPGCLLLDICMPDMDGLTVMSRLVARGCTWPLIAMTGHGDVPTAVAAMKLGAIEFIEKPLERDLVDAAIRRALVQLEISETRRRKREIARAMLATLTPKESAVLRELMTGQLNKGVAHRLGLSVRTVEMHRANLLAKLGLRTLQETVALFALCAGGAPDPAS